MLSDVSPVLVLNSISSFSINCFPVGNAKSQQLHVITKLDAEEIKEDIFEEVAFVPMLSGTSIDGNDS